MKPFLDKNFLLQSELSKRLYHEYAAPMPIIDYHCHLSPKEIAEDRIFENLTQAWLEGDHYKWRAMRIQGVNEEFITGKASDYEKFLNWAKTVPYCLRNPLYHWTHLELQRYFGIDQLLSPESAEDIYIQASEKLKSKSFSVRNLLRRMNVKMVCTTDDPTDMLEYHQELKKSGFEIPVLPAFRPDAAMNADNPSLFMDYVLKLDKVTGKAIKNFDDYVIALKARHDFFHDNGCRISDHGLEEIYAEDFTESEIKSAFLFLLSGKDIDLSHRRKFKSALLRIFALWDHEKGWVQQFHLGAMRNNNTRLYRQLGSDTGSDSIGDFKQARTLSKFLDALDRENKLAKTIIYNLNPADNAVMATMIGNFCDGSVPGKIQWGSAWWFLDQRDGMINQMNGISNMGLLSRFVGMITDSRSFLSYPRHEYFRRILCDLFGTEINNGEIPNDPAWVGKIIQDICYHNARDYFDWPCPINVG